MDCRTGCTIRPVTRADVPAWIAMRCDLWPEGSEAEHGAEIEAFFTGRETEPLAVLVAETADGALAGFAEMSIRPYAEGCETKNIAYLEGWYVAPHARRQGVGTALIDAAAAWGVAQGCRELASDTQPDNAISAAAHLHAGFSDAGLVRCFKKTLVP